MSEQGSGGNYIMRSLIICIPHKNIIPVIKSRKMRMVGHVARMGDRKVAYRVFVGKLEGKRLLGRPRLRLDNIKMGLQKV
jgi:hypothetical protein